MKTYCDVEAELSLTLDQLIEYGNYEFFLEEMAEKIGHSNAENLEVEPIGVVDIGGGVKKIRLRVRGTVEVRDGEEQSPAP